MLSRPQLDPDDARYLEIVDRMAADPLGSLPGAFVVENRWDHLWWVDQYEPVRFFRPAVVTSYAVDAGIARFGIAEQLLLTNILLHMACGLVFMSLALRWMSAAPAILAGALFVGFAAHAENVWYIAGRTGTLAALGTLGALTLHVAGTRRARAMAVAAFAFGLLAKETAAVVPVLCVFADSWIERRGTVRQLLRRDRSVYLGYAAVLGAYLIVRAVALGGAGIGFAPPYLMAPTDPAFAGHLAAQAVSYSQNLAAGVKTAPFSNLPAVLDATHVTSALAAGAMSTVLVLSAVRNPVARFGLLLAALTWLPASIAYLSERYVFLPSAGIALAAGAAVGLPHARAARLLACCLLGAWTLHQGTALRQRNHYNGVETTRGPARLARTLAPIRSQIPAGAHLWLVNLPGGWIEAQFARSTLRVLLGDPTLEVQVLTLLPRLPELGRSVSVARDPAGGVQVRSDTDPVMLDFPKSLRWRALDTGSEFWSEDGALSIEVARGGGEFAHALRFQATDAPVDPIVLVWRADPDLTLSPLERLANARVEMIPR